MNQERSAGIEILIFPHEVPGEIIFEVNNLGPVNLTRSEVVWMLRNAADNMEAGAEQTESDS